MRSYYTLPFLRKTRMSWPICCHTFGSLADVLNAPEEELLQVPGVGESTVMLLKFIPQLFRRYTESAKQGIRRICTFEEAGEYFFPKFVGRENEMVFLMLLDGRGKILYCDAINEGSVNASNIYIRDLVRLAVRYNASSAVLAHNHPSGTCLPSTQDLETTRAVASALESVEVLLMDHIIVGGENYLSRQNQEFFLMCLEANKFLSRKKGKFEMKKRY